MTSEQLHSLLDDVMQDIKTIFATKGEDYSSNTDRLSNFKRLTKLKITPFQALWVYVDKHLCAIEKYAANGAIKSEDIKDRLLDVIVYCILAMGLVEERELADKRTG
jgi:hypothetical protein